MRTNTDPRPLLALLGLLIVALAGALLREPATREAGLLLLGVGGGILIRMYWRSRS